MVLKSLALVNPTLEMTQSITSSVLSKIHLWQKYLCAIAVIFTLTANFWFVQYILTEPSGGFAPILSRRNYGNPMIPIVMILLWKQNMAGIRSLQVNVLNAALHFRECGYHQNNGFVSVVAGKMISSPIGLHPAGAQSYGLFF
jgi:hypothetical protein